MLKIAITGNIASGKSQVEKFISEKYTVYDADKIAHQILGNVDRKKLGEKVFSDPAARKKLEEFIHPKVKDEILKIFEQNMDVVFISIPLLFETGFDALFDKIIFVQCDDDIRLQRLMRRNDFTEEQALKRMNAQLPQKEKMQKSDLRLPKHAKLSCKDNVKTHFVSCSILLFIFHSGSFSIHYVWYSEWRNFRCEK